MTRRAKFWGNVVLMGLTVFGFCVPEIQNAFALNRARKALFAAVETNSYAAVRQAAAEQVRCCGRVDEYDDLRRCPTVVAVCNDKREAVRALLDAGADVNQNDRGSANTLLYVAVENKHQELAAYLLKRGARLSVLDIGEANPLCPAVETEQVEMTRLLLHAGANVCYADVGSSPLHLMKTSNKLEIRAMAWQIDRAAGGTACP